MVEKDDFTDLYDITQRRKLKDQEGGMTLIGMGFLPDLTNPLLSELSGGGVIVLIVLCHITFGGRRPTFCTNKEISAITGISESTIKKIMTKLEALRLIQRDTVKQVAGTVFKKTRVTNIIAENLYSKEQQGEGIIKPQWISLSGKGVVNALALSQVKRKKQLKAQAKEYELNYQRENTPPPTFGRAKAK